MSFSDPTDRPSDHADPITGTPGSHPLGTGLGAATLGAAGAIAGSAVPGVWTVLGAAVGATIGAIAGGLAGHGVSEAVDPTDPAAVPHVSADSRDEAERAAEQIDSM